MAQDAPNRADETNATAMIVRPEGETRPTISEFTELRRHLQSELEAEALCRESLEIALDRLDVEHPNAKTVCEHFDGFLKLMEGEG